MEQHSEVATAFKKGSLFQLFGKLFEEGSHDDQIKRIQNMRQDQDQRIIIESNTAYRQKIRNDRRFEDHCNHNAYHNYGAPSKL